MTARQDKRAVQKADAERQTRPRALDEYRRKRRFADTPEPDAASDTSITPELGRFVVHEHHARRLHWDLRLEHEGALASWAVPNGIPDDPRRNRKAIHVEDHPLDYIDFEGTIPAGNYGAGAVAIWDSGTYVCEKWKPTEVMVRFQGKRLEGRYVLFRAGRTEKDWMIHRMDPAVDPTAQELPGFIEPMLAKLSTLPANDSEWGFEVKWDGMRAVAHSQPGHIRFLSRNRNEITAAYPELRSLNQALGSHTAILDGEIVAFDDDGRPSFQMLQRRMHVRGEAAVKRLSLTTPVTYLVFDLLWLDGHSLTELPYGERRERLDALGLESEHWSVPEFHRGHGLALLQATRQQGLEGIVGKRLNSRYVPGSRSAGWVKIKNSMRQEVVIGGWTSGRGSRANGIGALHVGVYDGEGKLRYAGRVGTGFDAKELARLSDLLAPLARKHTPFTGRQPAKGAHLVDPILVCEVSFSEWTRAGTLRQGSYQGLRDDKPAAEVVREHVSEPEESDHVDRSEDQLPPAGRQMGVEQPDAAAWVEAGRKVPGGVEVEVEGRTLKLTNLEKVLYPKAGFTKADLISYYAAVAPILLPHLRDHPLTLKRYPNGVDGDFFYEKRSPAHRPEWVRTVSVPRERGGHPIDYTLCQDLPTLVWLANLADIELHPSLSLASAIERPSTLVFDLDPGAPASIVECCDVALELHRLFEQLNLATFAKTSGSKGLQVYVPLNQTQVTYEQTKRFAHAVARLLEQRNPELIVSAMAKSGRRGKVLIDWSQNDAHKTTVSVYSLRATQRPAASTPVDWAEVSACLSEGKPELLAFGPDHVLGRVRDRGDLFAETLSLQQPLPQLEG